MKRWPLYHSSWTNGATGTRGRHLVSGTLRAPGARTLHSRNSLFTSNLWSLCSAVVTCCSSVSQIARVNSYQRWYENILEFQTYSYVLEEAVYSVTPLRSTWISCSCSFSPYSEWQQELGQGALMQLTLASNATLLNVLNQPYCCDRYYVNSWQVFLCVSLHVLSSSGHQLSVHGCVFLVVI